MPQFADLLGSRRVRAIVGLLHPALPVWDLCCDHGYIGRTALDWYPDASVVFVDRATHPNRTLAESLGRSARFAGRYRLLCADVLKMELPAEPVSFVIAGVSSVVIRRFLQRLAGRRGDCVVCNTFHDPERFEAGVPAVGLVIQTRLDVATRRGLQRVWRLQT